MAFLFRLTGGKKTYFSSIMEQHYSNALPAPAGTVNSCFLNCWFRTIIQQGITFSSMK